MPRRFPEEINLIFKYGAFAKPAAVYAKSCGIDKEWKIFLDVISYEWQGKLKRAVKEIDTLLKRCRIPSVRYILLAKKLSCLRRYGEFDVKLYEKLKREFASIPKPARKIVSTILISFYATTNADIHKTRIWSDMYSEDRSTQVFMLISRARFEVKHGNFQEAERLYCKAYEIAKEIPHPTGQITSLNDLAWDLRKEDTEKAFVLASKAAYKLGYYREAPGNMFSALDTLFEIEKDLGKISIKDTARIIASFETVPNHYKELRGTCKRFVPELERRIYKNSVSFRKYIKSRVSTIKKLSIASGVSIGRLSEILTGKTENIRSYTIRKLIKALNIESTNIKDLPYCVYSEIMKMEIEKEFKEAIEDLKNLSLVERRRLLISTYMAMINRSEFYLSRKEKLREAYELLEKAEEFERYMKRRYETMQFASDMINAHPYIEGRKAATRKALDRIGSRKLNEFIRRYIDLDERDKKLMDTFLRNYGRYDGVRFGIRMKGPEEIRTFAKKYHLKIQPAMLAYWSEEDGRVRRKIKRVLKSL